MAAYRDPLQAAQTQVERALEHAAEREQQMAPALIQQLSARMRRKLELAFSSAREERSGLDGLRESEKALTAYAELLDQVLARAPRLEKRYNRLPRFFPDRIKPRQPYLFADVFSPTVEKLRTVAHRVIKKHDSDATIHDLRKRYFDQEVEPFLVDACFKAWRAPIRLHVVPVFSGHDPSMLPSRMTVYISMLTLVRSSTPHILLEHQHWGKRVLKMLRLQGDTVVGRPRIDDMFVISALPDDAARLLTDTVCEALLDLAHASVPTLEVNAGLARVEWKEVLEDGRSINAACRLLAGLRSIAPTPLLLRKATR
jgi:hypothetical protein